MEELKRELDDSERASAYLAAMREWESIVTHKIGDVAIRTCATWPTREGLYETFFVGKAAAE
jgi:hypothetical protein